MIKLPNVGGAYGSCRSRGGVDGVGDDGGILLQGVTPIQLSTHTTIIIPSSIDEQSVGNKMDLEDHFGRVDFTCMSSLMTTCRV